MTALMAMSLSLLMVGTAFLSGIFGMAGGLILIGVLLVVFPLPTAMVLHAVTQMASNGWRAALWFRHIVWKSMAFYVAGCLVSVGLWSLTLYVPDKAVTPVSSISIIERTPVTATCIGPKLRGITFSGIARTMNGDRPSSSSATALSGT